MSSVSIVAITNKQLRHYSTNPPVQNWSCNVSKMLVNAFSSVLWVGFVIAVAENICYVNHFFNAQINARRISLFLRFFFFFSMLVVQKKEKALILLFEHS